MRPPRCGGVRARDSIGSTILWGTHGMEIYRCAADYIRLQRPERPVLALRPHAAERAARWFIENFPGKSLYAVKANNAPQILHALHRAGVRDFDVASLAEIEQVSALEGGQAHVMHPIKSRRLIREAYFEHGIRTLDRKSTRLNSSHVV